ncbi:MAG TPA: hypothetical protein VFJ82_01870 [Longimicrobium sp.]|nr:hypothetical protein [Longimicrobium sp.]
MSHGTPPGTIATRPPALGVARLRPVPAFAVLLGFLLLIGMIQSLHVGFSGPFRDLGGAAPRADMRPACLALADHDPSHVRWLPDSLRLTPAVEVRSARFGTWYVAFEPDGRRRIWRPAGADSIDLSGHHIPVSRLPARGAHRVGRGGWPGYAHLWDALTSRQWRVDAREIACWPVGADSLDPRWEGR